jgi:hypothetical protein
MEKYLKRLFANVEMSSVYGSAGGRELSNPKNGAIKKRQQNQSTRIHERTITIDDLRELWYEQKGLCHWLGIEMDLEGLFISHHPFAPSVDRIDGKRGYHRDNIVLTTRFANRGRGCYESEDFYDILMGKLENRVVLREYTSKKMSTLE